MGITTYFVIMKSCCRIPVFYLLALGLALNAVAGDERPQLVFGAVADLQYADKDSKGARDYRGALVSAEQLVDALNRARPAFLVVLGDLIDGWGGDVARSVKDWERIIIPLKRLTMPWYAVAGNHDMAVGLEKLRETFGGPSLYADRTFPTLPGWRFVMLDSNEWVGGRSANDQRAWLTSVLARAAGAGEKIMVWVHHPFAMPAPRLPMHGGVADAVLKQLEDSGCVKMILAGHHHGGGYLQRRGIHHVTLRGSVESGARGAWALIRIFTDRLEVDGRGLQPRYVCMLAPSVPSRPER
jgi:3',5'-cyclic AMP phosphodiesterase CpdA